MVHLQRLKAIKCCVIDVDGVMTDGRVWSDGKGSWLRMFNVLDGAGIKLLLKKGYTVAVITAAHAEDIRIRMDFLGVTHLYEKAENKEPYFEDLLYKLNLLPAEVAYIGDDLLDVPLIRRAGFGATVPGGVDEAKEAADYITTRAGGFGAVREICDLILRYGHWAEEF